MNTLLLITVGLVCLAIGALITTAGALYIAKQAVKDARIEGALTFYEKVRDMLDSDDVFHGYYVDEHGDYTQQELNHGRK